MKQTIDDQVQTLLNEVNSRKDSKLKELETAKEQLECDEVIIESFKKYSKELKKKETSCDIALVADDLHTRAIELKDLSVNDFCSVDITFTTPDLYEQADSLVGQVDGQDKLIGFVETISIILNITFA